MNIYTGKGEMTLINLLAIWSISAVVSLPGLAVSPIMGDLTKIFPKVSDLEIQMLTSLPSLLIIPFVLISGKLSESRGKIRMLFLGLGMFLVSGVLFFFAKSMTALILFSCLLGIGAGIIIPLSTGLVADYFSGRYRTKQLGLCSAINNVTLVLATSLTGYLATINWHLPFVVYLLPGISIVLAMFLKRNPPTQSVDTAGREGIDKPKLVTLMLFYGFVTYAVLAVVFYLPFVIENHKISSSVSGMMISLFFLAIMAPGLFINRIVDITKRNVNFLSLIAIAAGLILTASSHHVGLMTAGVVLTGAGYGVMQPLIYDKASQIASPKSTTLALAFVMAVNYLAILVCPFIVKFFQMMVGTDSNFAPFWINALLVIGVTLHAYRKRNSFAYGFEAGKRAKTGGK